jgi:hypothetical protein
MKNLNNTTLICIDTVQPEEAILSMIKCMQFFDFAKCKFFTDSKSASKNYKKYDKRIDIIDIGDIKNIAQYSEFCLKKLDDYVDTDYCLTVQHDGFIVRPKLWTDEFLEYDYIGAPWPEHWGYVNRVGNGGFNLKSKKFISICKILCKDIDMQTNKIIERGNISVNDDYISCITLYKEMLEQGIKYAPVELAARFSTERIARETLEESFGFHEKFTNFTREAYLEKYIDIAI